MYNHNSLVKSVLILIDMANKIGVKIEMISLDKEFYTAQVFRDFNRKRIFFVIRMRSGPMKTHA